MDPKPEPDLADDDDLTEVSTTPPCSVVPAPVASPPSSARRRELVLLDRAPDSGASLDGFPRPIDPRSFPAARITFAAPLSLERLQVVPRSAYTIGGDVAAGGVGRVLRARDERLGRPVALKEMRFDPHGPDGERFVREVMITAKLQHPSIVTIYEAGRWPSGEPFYAMELVEGRSLADVVAERPALADRLALLPHVIDAADAVAYAHSRSILHRDLKPANVLVGSFGETVVIDWGLAKDTSVKDPVPEPGARAGALQGHDPPDTLTMAGAVLGTPAYMPPEQAAGRPVDERADVYALGALVYHLVAGAPPYEGRTPMRVIRKVIEGPPRPLAQRQPELPAELASIVTKAMAREPGDRYPSARAFAEDLRRYANGQEVSAHVYATVDRLYRFTARHRSTVWVAVAASAILAIAGTFGFFWVLLARNQARDRLRQAERAEAQAIRHADDLTLVQARSTAARDPARAVAWLRTLSPRFDRWSAARTIAEDARAHGIATVTAAHAGAVNDVAFSADGRLLATSSDDHQVRVWDVGAGKSTVVEGHSDEVWMLLFLRDGRTLASAGKDRTVRLVDLATWHTRTLSGHEGPVTSLAGSSDGRLVVSSSFDRTLRIWDTVTAESWALRGSGDEVRAVALSADRRKVASGRMDGTVQLWDLDRGHERTLGRLDAAVLQLAFSGDDRDLIVALWNGAVHSFRTDRVLGIGGDAARGTTGAGRLLSGPIRGYDPTSYHALAQSRDGKLLVFGREDGVAVLDQETGTQRVLSGGDPRERFTSVAISPDQRLVAAGSNEHTAHVWDLAAGTVRTLHGFDGSGVLVVFSPDGNLIAAAGSSDRAVRLHPVHEEVPQVRAHPDGVTSARLSADGKLLVTGGRDGTARLWDLPSTPPGEHRASQNLGQPRPVTLDGHRGATVVALAPDGLTVATAGEEGSVRVWDTSGRLLRTFEARPGKRPLLTFSPDGRLVAFAGAGDSVRVGEVEGGSVRIFAGHGGPVESLAFAPRGDRLVSGGQDGTVRFWDPSAAGAGARILSGHAGAVTALAFSPDGATLLSGGKDHTLRFWPTAGGEPRVLAVGGGGVQRVMFTRDGRTVIHTSQLESVVHFVDAATGRDLGALAAHEGDLLSIALSPDETRVVAATTEGKVRLWDRRTGESRTVPGHVGVAREVMFSPDGRFVISAGDDGYVRLWADDLPEDPEALRAWLQRAGGEGAAALVAVEGASAPEK